MWENHVPPFDIYSGGTCIISGGPSGHSVIHPPGKWHSGFKWDKTFASGISISKLHFHTGAMWRCYVTPHPPHHLRQEVRLKRDSEMGRATQTGGKSVVFISDSVSHQPLLQFDIHTSSPNTRAQMADVLPHHHQTRPHLLTSVNLHSLRPPQKIASHATTVSIAPEPVLPWCLALFKEKPIRHCSGQAVY